MNSSIEPAVTAPDAASTQARLSAHLDRAFELQAEGQLSAAQEELEAGLAEARSTPDDIEFQSRVMLVLVLADAYQSGGETEKARAVLAEEKEFAESFFQSVVATGTLIEKRMAAGGVTQLRDRATQLSLIGREAPEIDIQTWINSEPLTLEDLRGRVVLLEFWATWCKPCQEMFPKLRQLHEE